MESTFGLTILIALILGLFSYIFISLIKSIRQTVKDDKSVSEELEETTQVKTRDVLSSKHGNKASKKPVRSSAKHVFSHPDLQCSFKGHTNFITSGAVSTNGKGIVTAAEDRTLFFYNVRDAFNGTVLSIQGTRTNINLDHVLKLCWSPDYTAIVVQKADSLQLEVLKGTKKPDGTLTGLTIVREFPKPFENRLVGLKVANNGKFIMTCDEKNQLSLWDLKGELLTTCDTRHGDTLSATLSLDDKFVVTTGFTPDAKVYEVEYEKQGDFKSLKKVFNLMGHNSKIFSCDISSDSGKMVTVSKDGTWMLYNTNVEYKKKQDPKILCKGSVESARNVTDNSTPCVVKLSPDTRVVLVSVLSTVYCYSAAKGDLMRSIEDIYSGAILDVFFDAANQYFITLGGNCAHLFYNVSGYLESIQDLEISLKEATYSGLRDRINAQLEATRSTLKKIEDRQNNSDTKKRK